MAGFKSGAADDDWGDADDDWSDDGRSDEDDDATQVDDVASRQHDDPETDRVATTISPTEQETPRLPWIHRRNSITDGREKTVQLHLQAETIDAERDGMSRVENRIGESVRKADLREAALLVGLEHSDDVADLLRKWGYGIE